MKYTKNATNYHLRPAKLADIPDALALFADEVKAGRMLARNEENMKTNILDWQVVTLRDQIIGCVSLVFYSDIFCEIRSLAVSETYRKNGLGKKLIEAALALAKEHNVKKVLTLTRAPELFEDFDFQKNEIGNFPEKVQQDCQPCPFIHNCDEVALLYQFSEGGLD